ncbi:GTP pyrophosphokinase family protein [Clostridium sp. MB05]
MELELFNFVENVTASLEDLGSELEEISKDIESYFAKVLEDYNEGYLNINSRVKSTTSLREKILRNSYYKKYKNSEEFISNLSDLVGVRIECRFIEDEKTIHKMLKKHFNIKGLKGYFYNDDNANIRLELESKQPQKQKNGFGIYRIDGLYQHNNRSIKFELQIKSLVNIFWGEIEHKVIYKNNNYMLGDEFIKNIMLSIKENLYMIDRQLLAVDNQFNKVNSINPEARKEQLEKLLSKIIYDIYSRKMKNDIGFIIDFRESCDTIMKYIFRTNNAKKLEDYSETLIKTLARLNDISTNDVSFNTELKFERDLHFESDFCNIIGNTILKSINSDFKWNLFFRILFEIELGNNSEDFENFINFIENRFYESTKLPNLYLLFKKEEAQDIKNLFMKEIALSFREVDSIKFIYDSNIMVVNKAINKSVDLIQENIKSYIEWEAVKDDYLNRLRLDIVSRI